MTVVTSGSVRRRAPSPGREAALLVASVLAAALLAALLAPLGIYVVYAIVGLTLAGIATWAIRADVVPPLRAALDSVHPRWHSRRRTRSRAVRIALGFGVVVTVVALAFVVVTVGKLAMAGIGALLVLAVAMWLCWPLLRDLALIPAEDVAPRLPPRSHGRTGGGAAGRTRVAGPGRTARLVGSAVIVGATAFASFVLAQLGIKGVIAAAGAIVLVALLFLVRNRSIFFTFLSVVSLTIVLHKSIGPEDLTLSGGAISIYVTTFDAMLLVLYGLWIHEGSFVADVRAALSNPRSARMLSAPLVGALFLLPSVLVAPSADHCAAELFRMAWMYLLFFYAAVRIRTRRHIWAVLAGLAVFATLEFVVVVLQWQTGGVLGLSFLGVPTALTQRVVSDTESLGRPFGTIIHPVFMGAVMASLALVALSVGITSKRSLTKITALVMVALCTIPLYLSHTRASLIAALIAAVYVVGFGLRRGWLQWQTLGRIGLAGLVSVAVFWGQLSAKFTENFGTGHFWEEVQSRLQLNGIAFNMINDHPGLGVGLNNFEVVEPRYESHFVIFFGNPVHNIYLLYWAETGIVGLAGFMFVAIAMLRAAYLATRTHDRLLSGVAVGVVAMMIFLSLEELLGFSVRQDLPLAVYWLLAGLAVACRTIAADVPAAPRPRRHAPVRPAAARSRGRRPSRRSAPSVRRRPAASTRRRGIATLLATAGLAGVVTANAPATAAGVAPPLVVFQATPRGGRLPALFTVDQDGQDLHKISPTDGRIYQWPRWAFDNHKIVYTARRSYASVNIEMMNPDGTDRQVISTFNFLVAQPIIDPAGRYLYFTGFAPWFPVVSQFRMNLSTLQSVNLSARTSPTASIDADPLLLAHRAGLYVVSGQSDRADIDQLSLDGTRRSTVVDDGRFNTDPDVSPNGRQLVISSYRGAGTPDVTGSVAALAGKPKTHDFILVTRDIASGRERALTRGVDCASRAPRTPCRVSDMSAYVPRYFDGGKEVAFTGALSRVATCICLISLDGSLRPRALVASLTLGIEWFDLQGPGSSASREHAVGRAEPRSQVLLTAAGSHGGRARLYACSPDLMHRRLLALPKRYAPVQARWSPDRRQVVFTARVPIPTTQATPHPAAPAGRHRREHVTLADIEPDAIALRAPAVPARSLAEDQVFLRSADGSVRRLTDPWIEDWQDGVRLGDARANVDPVFTPDGSAVIVTNISTLTGESFLLRIDLRTGAVLNLTNGTSGAIPVTDGGATFSPDGSRIAFVTSVGGISDVYTMNAHTGFDVREVSRTQADDKTPVWLPGSSTVLSLSTRDGRGIIAATDVDTHRTRVFDGGRHGRIGDPTPAPDGASLLFLATSPTGVSVWTRPVDGNAVLLQPDPLHQVLYVDWR